MESIHASLNDLLYGGNLGSGHPFGYLTDNFRNRAVLAKSRYFDHTDLALLTENMLGHRERHEQHAVILRARRVQDPGHEELLAVDFQGRPPI